MLGLPLRDGDGEIWHWFQLLIDVDDRKRAEEALQQAERKSRMILNRTLRDNAGNVEQWCGSVDEIEGRQRVEESLRAAELDTRLAMDSVDGMICMFAPDGVLDGGNRQLLDYFQMPLEEVMNWATNGIIHPDDLQHWIDTLTASVTSGEPYDFDIRFRRFDGVYRWFRLRGLPLRNAKDQIVRWYGLLTDIHDRKHAEEELKRNEMLLAEAERMSQSGTFSWMIESDILTFSEELNRIFGFETGATITFEAVRSRVHPEDLPILAQKMAEVRSGQDNPEYEIRLLMPDGATMHLRVAGRLIDWQSSRLECIGVVQDITGRKLAEQARDQLRSELARVATVTSLCAIAASIAHEVNQPLSGIITNASTSLRMLAANPPNLEGARETARRTIRDGNRAADVITRLRLLCSRRIPLVEHVDLNEAVREVVGLCSSDLHRARASLRTELAAYLPPVAGDRVQLQQVIVNLLRNSADAVAAVENQPRHIVIATAIDSEGLVCLSVSDSGVGFRSDDPARLFDAFYSTKSDGMGIGLSVSRMIVERHGGRLWAEANEGPGATFKFSVPKIDGELAATSDAGRPESSGVRS
jgi:PAS domain S-box-containing protein